MGGAFPRSWTDFFHIGHVRPGEEWGGGLGELKRDAVFAKNCFHKKIDCGRSFEAYIGAERIKASPVS